MASQVFNLSQFMRGRLDVWETDINTSNNTSTVNARVVVYRENDWWGDTFDDRTYVKLQMGSVVSVDETKRVHHNKSMGEVTIAEGAITATHNSSGGGSRTISVTVYSNLTANFRGSTTMEFTLANTGGGTPPDPPAVINTPTLSSNSISVPSSSGLTVYSNSPSSRYKHLVVIKEGQQTLIEDGYMFADSNTFSSSELRNGLLQRLQEVNPLYLQVHMQTYRDGNYIGEASTNLTVWFNNNTPPNPADFDYKDTNPSTQQFSIIAGKTIFIQNESNLVVEIPTSKKGSSSYGIGIRSYSASIGKITKNASYSSSSTVTLDMGRLDISGSKPLTLVTYDDNYSSALRTKEITIIPYRKPAIKAVAERVNVDSNDVVLRINGLFYPIQIDGQARNTINSSTGVRWRYKEDQGSFSNWAYRPASVSNNGELGLLSTPDLALTLNKTKEYTFEVEVADVLNTVKLTFNASVGVPKVWIGEDGRNAIGGLPKQGMKPTDIGTLEVHGTIYTNGKEVATKDDITSGGSTTTACPYEVGDIYITTNPAYSTPQAVANRWQGTSWERYAEGRTLVGYDRYQGEFNSVGKTGGSKTVALSESQMPRHNHRVYSGYTDEYADRDALRYQYWAKYSRGYNNGSSGTPFIENSGSGYSHNNLQPYITTYMWRRTG